MTCLDRVRERYSVEAIEDTLSNPHIVILLTIFCYDKKIVPNTILKLNKQGKKVNPDLGD